MATLYFPAGHELHSVNPVLAPNLPAWHAVHAVAPVSLVAIANLPVSHGWHSLALAPLYFPVGHELHSVNPFAAANLPAWHAAQDAMPVSRWIWPSLHAAQCAFDVCAMCSLIAPPVTAEMQILKPVNSLEPSETNLNVVGPDTASEAGNAALDDALPQYFVSLPLT
jgi:hypothetical protein